jgi:hypothetical protein
LVEQKKAKFSGKINSNQKGGHVVTGIRSLSAASQREP